MTAAVSCERCARLEAEIVAARAELVGLGRTLERPFGIGADHDCERALARWLTSTRTPNSADGYRAGWAAFGRHVGPQLREWQALWRAACREQDQLRSRIGTLLTQISRLGERG